MFSALHAGKRKLQSSFAAKNAKAMKPYYLELVAIYKAHDRKGWRTSHNLQNSRQEGSENSKGRVG